MVFVSVPPLRLLLIDDSSPFRETLARLLRVAGHTVFAAEAGSAGLAILHAHPVDLVLTDRDMPGLSGWDVARLVKTTYPRLPVVLMTGGAGSGPLDVRTVATVDAVLWKPFPFTELLAIIGRLTQGGASVPIGRAPGLPTGEAEPKLVHEGHQPGAPVGADVATGQPYRRMRRSMTKAGGESWLQS
jgi:two-component system, OmpR family, response regulator MprA